MLVISVAQRRPSHAKIQLTTAGTKTTRSWLAPRREIMVPINVPLTTLQQHLLASTWVKRITSSTCIVRMAKLPDKNIPPPSKMPMPCKLLVRPESLELSCHWTMKFNKFKTTEWPSLNKNCPTVLNTTNRCLLLTLCLTTSQQWETLQWTMAIPDSLELDLQKSQGATLERRFTRETPNHRMSKRPGSGEWIKKKSLLLNSGQRPEKQQGN